MYLSGNFGEIRLNHFHSGIDIKTQGVTGFKVYAIADGYISRIKVQANGYGKALYVTHPNGYTSVYAHLDSYRQDIKDYVTAAQYRQKSFEIDLYPEPSVFKVKKEEVIALSGNSGGSSGPHLHFEIRDQDQQPLNVLKFPIDIKDNVPPVFRSIYFYPIDGGQVEKNDVPVKIVAIKKENSNYVLASNTISVHGKVGIGVEVYDYLDGSASRCGIYSLELERDSQLINQFSIDYLSFNTTRYVNAHIDYRAKIEQRSSVHKMYLLPNNKLHLYQYANKDGVLDFEDTIAHPIEIVARDAYGNASTLSFLMKGAGRQQFYKSGKKTELNVMRYDMKNSFQLNDISIDIPAYSLYDNIDFKFIKLPSNGKYISPIYKIHDAGVPLQKYYKLSIKPDSGLYKNVGKIYIAKIDDSGNQEYVGGEWKNGFITTETRNFGNYLLMIDSAPPSVRPLNFINKANLTGNNIMSLIVQDDLSGLERFDAYIDGKWALFDHDKKNNIFVHEFDTARFELDKEHTLKIVAVDNMKNMKEATFLFFK